MPALGKGALHERLLDALGGSVEETSISDVPLLIGVPQIVVPLAIWAFTLTNPPGGRHPAESKIQLIMPGQRRGELGNFDGPPGVFKLLIGVHPTEALFVLWDAYKQKNFSWSKNVQVRGPLLWDASVAGIATGERRLAGGAETVIVSRSDRPTSSLRRTREAQRARPPKA